MGWSRMIGNHSQAQIEGEVIPGRLPGIAHHHGNDIGARDHPFYKREQIKVSHLISLPCDGLDSSRDQLGAVEVNPEWIEDAAIIVRASGGQQEFLDCVRAGQELLSETVSWLLR